MSKPLASRAAFDEDAAEQAALAEAVAMSRANARGVSHDAMRAWLREIADGNFQAQPPASKLL